MKCNDELPAGMSLTPLLHTHCYNGVISFLLGYEAITHTPYYCSLRVVISIMYKLLDSLRLNVCKLFAALPTSQQQIVFAANPPVSSHTHKLIM